MKKLLAAFLTLALIMGMSLTAMADDPAYEDASTAEIKKVYVAANEGVSPAETFSFTDLTCISVTDAAEDVTADNAPVPTIGSVAFAEGDATADGAEKTATITLPKYTSVGVYTYQFNEVIPTSKTAGVTYNETDLFLVVTVIEQGGKVRVAAVHCEGSSEPGEYGVEPKTDEFENTYESGTLAVTKTVTGNLGDKSKYFDVTVTFEAAEGEAINSTITYSGGQYDSDVTVADNTATIQVKDGDTVTFSNVPEGVTWTVSEADYTGEGYDEAVISVASGTMGAGDAATSEITNNKEAEIDTGINMDSLPYIVIIAVVAVAALVFFMKRRGSVEE